MFKIGEFSRLGQVSVRMLRHYDALGLLAPSHTDSFTGYRYYTIDQLPRLHQIVALNHLGLTLEQVGVLLRSDQDLSNEQLRGMLALRHAELEQELAAREFQLRAVAARLQQLESAAPAHEIIIRSLEPLVIASVRELVPTIDAMATYCANLYQQLYAALQRHELGSVGPELTLYHAEEYSETGLDTEVAIVVDPALLRRPGADGLAVRELPGAAQAASLVFNGAYDDLAPTALALLGWVARHGFRPAGPLRELHLSGPAHPDSGPVVASAVLELQLPILPL